MSVLSKMCFQGCAECTEIHIFCVGLAEELEPQGGSPVLGAVEKLREFSVVLLLGCTLCACVFTCREGNR